jgi:dimethylargininase
MRFTNAIVRSPCEKMTEGLSSADLGKPDYTLALKQHHEYVLALEACGLKVRVLPPDDNYPDSTFVEDTALLTEGLAIITHPGAASRKGEVHSMSIVIHEFFDTVAYILDPGTLEAGDVMMVGKHFFVGLSERTNIEGAQQLNSILESHGMKLTVVEIKDMLHLKSGVSYLENNMLLAVEQFESLPAFGHLDILPVPAQEAYAANSVWINDTVLVPDGYPVTMQNIMSAGYEVIVLDMSEFRKLDGGLSCLSLRF